jgi:GTP pyrophosphokinase
MRVVCRDKKGLLAEVSTVISSMDINISHAEVETRPADMQAILSFEVNVSDLQQFNQVLAAIKKLKSVISVERVKTA